jgi:hypothetical protein
MEVSVQVDASAFFTPGRPNVAIGVQSCLVFGRFRVKMSAGDKLSWLRWGRGFAQSLQENVRIVPKIHSWPLPSTFFGINYLLTIPSLDTLVGEVSQDELCSSASVSPTIRRYTFSTLTAPLYKRLEQEFGIVLSWSTR